jgi:hypothetical protein
MEERKWECCGQSARSEGAASEEGFLSWLLLEKERFVELTTHASLKLPRDKQS